MAIKINGATLKGIHGHCVAVEIHITRGLPSFNIVGMGDTAIKESKERVRAAITNSGFQFPLGKITVNLAPADLKKEGTLLDLPIAIGILIGSKQLFVKNIEECLLLGELSLLSELRSIKGSLPIIMEGIENGIKKFIIPDDNKKEASIINGANIYPCQNLHEVIEVLSKEKDPYKVKYVNNSYSKHTIDFSEIIGQHSAKRGVLVAAAGNHNLILYGPPGIGKSMIANRVPTILPKITYEESLECTRIYSVVGELKEGLINTRPFRNPHHTTTKTAMVGGGANLIPGEISLAHNGVLFLDEMLEFKREVLECLRQPLENKSIQISKATGKVEYPSNFMLIGALNTCPCSKIPCTCSDYEKSRYLKKLSGPLLNRIDLFLSVDYIDYNSIKSNHKQASSDEMKAKIAVAREIQNARFKNYKIKTNGEMTMAMVKKYCILDKAGETIMERIFKNYSMSLRAYSKILKVSRTIADLEEREIICEGDLIEAFHYRKFMEEVV